MFEDELILFCLYFMKVLGRYSGASRVYTGLNAPRGSAQSALFCNSVRIILRHFCTVR